MTKLYLDTSVWSFAFAEDSPDFRQVTMEFLKTLKDGKNDIYISEVVIREVKKCIEPLRSDLLDLLQEVDLNVLDLEDEIINLVQPA